MLLVGLDLVGPDCPYQPTEKPLGDGARSGFNVGQRRPGGQGVPVCGVRRPRKFFAFEPGVGLRSLDAGDTDAEVPTP